MTPVRRRAWTRRCIEGPGETVTTENGDRTSFEPFQAHARDASSGLVLVVVRATPGQTDRIRPTASDGGRRGDVAFITAAGSP